MFPYRIMRCNEEKERKGNNREAWDTLCIQFVIYFFKKNLKINLSSGKKRKWILTESNETYTECSRLQINVMCQTILEENVYWLSNEHRKIRKSG